MTAVLRASAVPSQGWAAALAEVLADPARPALVFQPIVDLRRGIVCGYEALSRFDPGVACGPDRWFAAADELGLGARLEARVVRAALAARETLPAGCFLTVNVSPHLLPDPELADVLLAEPDLTGVVLELTEHVQVGDSRRLTDLIDRLRAAGAAIALHDAGSGYSGLQQLALLRPQFVKLDRALVDHADRDEAKLALAELLGSYSGRLDAWLLVEGVERMEELAAFVRLGVPLAQGYLLARPGPGWPQIDPALGAQLRAMTASAQEVDSVAALVERVPVVPADPGGELAAARALLTADPGLDLVVVVDPRGCPSALVRPGRRDGDGGADLQVLPVSLRVRPTAQVVDVAVRAMTRVPARRFDPVVCVDDGGAMQGVVRPERMTLRLAELYSGRPADDVLGTPAPDGPGGDR